MEAGRAAWAVSGRGQRSSACTVCAPLHLNDIMGRRVHCHVEPSPNPRPALCLPTTPTATSYLNLKPQPHTSYLIPQHQHQHQPPSVDEAAISNLSFIANLSKHIRLHQVGRARVSQGGQPKPDHAHRLHAPGHGGGGGGGGG